MPSRPRGRRSSRKLRQELPQGADPSPVRSGTDIREGALDEARSRSPKGDATGDAKRATAPAVVDLADALLGRR